MSDPLLSIENLSTYFDMGRGQQLYAVDDVSFTLQAGEILGLVGESGSGKSTLGKALVGLNHKTAGQVRYKGELLPRHYRNADFLRLSHHIQMIFQEVYSALSPRMTAAEILGEGLRLAGKSKAESQALVHHWVERVGLSASQLNRYPHEFSGGQRQRLGIARALALEPDILVCDEPVSALDVSVQAQIINLLDDIRREYGIAILFIAHDLSMVRYISDRIAVMYLGKLVEVGPAAAVFESPAHPYTQALIESNPLPDPVLEKQRKHQPITGEVKAPMGQLSGCLFADRCPHADDHCRSVVPAALEHSGGRLVACHKVS